MAFYNKIGLLILNDDATKFLVCQKYAQNVTADYIMPGGKNDENDDYECLKNEIKQELNCTVDFTSLQYLNAYEDVAAGRPDRTVEIKLYTGKIIGTPTPSTEIEKLHWIGAEAEEDERVSPIVRHKIIPDLLAKNILRK
jgi:8-oxo-dGTP pyrophosphatase MutT (NUDIX family)